MEVIDKDVLNPEVRDMGITGAPCAGAARC